MKPARLLQALCLTLFLLLSLPGCALTPEVVPVEGEEREQVLSVSEEMADNLFAGLNEGDYEVFSRDFDPTMKKALDEKAFQEMTSAFSEKVGAYQSRSVERVEQVEEITVVVYKAVFEKEEEVSVRLSLTLLLEPYKVSGLWFDSPRLREK